MLVGVYHDKGRVCDTPKSVETMILEIPWNKFQIYKQTKEQQIFKLTAELSRFPQLLLEAHRKNTSVMRKLSPGRKPMFFIELLVLTLDWADLPGAGTI